MVQGGDFNEIISLLIDNRLSDSEIRFFLGYSGWSNNQLDQELEINSWVVIQNKYKNEILGVTNSNFWKKKMIEFGGDYLIWSNAPENPNFN